MDDATTTIDYIIFDKKRDQKFHDDDSEIEYKQFTKYIDTYYKKFYCQKARRANDHTVLPTKNCNPHPDNCTLTFLGPVPPPEHNSFHKQPTTHDNLMFFENLSVSSLIPCDSTYNYDFKYSNDDCSVDSFLDYCQHEEDITKHVDSYDFVY